MNVSHSVCPVAHQIAGNVSRRPKSTSTQVDGPIINSPAQPWICYIKLMGCEERPHFFPRCNRGRLVQPDIIGGIIEQVQRAVLLDDLSSSCCCFQRDLARYDFIHWTGVAMQKTNRNSPHGTAFSLPSRGFRHMQFGQFFKTIIIVDHLNTCKYH